MSDLQSVLDEGAAQIVAAGAAPGVTAAVTDRERIVASAAHGVRRLGSDDRLTLADLMHIGSCTKALTAALCGRGVDQQLLSWTDPLSDLLDDVHPGRASATLVDVLAHRAGFAPYEEDDQIATLPDLPGDPVEQRSALARYVAAEEPTTDVGTEFMYSNAGFAVAASIVEQRSGVPWESAVPSLLGQIGVVPMLGWPAASVDDAPWGHLSSETPMRPHDPNDDYVLEPWIAPAGDVSLSAIDACAWMRANLDGLAGDEQILAAETWQTIHTAHGRAGLGWGVQDLAGQTASVHSGSAGTFLTLIVLLRGSELGIVINANAGDETAEGPTIELLKALVGAVA